MKALFLFFILIGKIMAMEYAILDINISSGGVKIYEIKAYKDYLEITNNQCNEKVLMNDHQISELKKINNGLNDIDSFQTLRVIKGGVWKFYIQSQEKKFEFYDFLEDQDLEDQALTVKHKEVLKNIMIFLQPYLANEKKKY